MLSELLVVVAIHKIFVLFIFTLELLITTFFSNKVIFTLMQAQLLLPGHICLSRNSQHLSRFEVAYQNN